MEEETHSPTVEGPAFRSLVLGLVLRRFNELRTSLKTWQLTD